MPQEGAGGSGGPRRPARGRMPRVGRPRRRGPLLPTLLVLVLAVIAFLVFADFYTDWLWYKSIGFSNVYSTRLRSQIVLFLVFGLLTGGAVALNAWLAYRFRPPFRGLSVEQQSLERYRVSGRAIPSLHHADPRHRHRTHGRIVGELALALLADVPQFRALRSEGPAVPHATCRSSRSGLPFWRYLLGFGFAIVLLSLLVTLAANYLYGGIRIQTPGERLTPAARAHVSVLLGVLVLLKAVAYWLDRFALGSTSQAGRQHGVVGHGCRPTRTSTPSCPRRTSSSSSRSSVRVLFFANVCAQTWLLPALGAGAARALRRRHRRGLSRRQCSTSGFSPSEPIREAPYIQRNIDATRAAYGIDGVQSAGRSRRATPPRRRRCAADTGTIAERRGCSTPSVSRRPSSSCSRVRGYYGFADPLDIDRYTSTARSRTTSSRSARSTSEAQATSRTGSTCT